MGFSPGCVDHPRAAQYGPLVDDAGARYGVDPDLLRAVIAQEGCWNPNAIRAEPRLLDASRGLMQVLYSTARDFGYTGPPEGLFDPAVNIEVGTRILARQLARYGSVADAVSSYNQGTSLPATALRAAGGGYRNQAYVDAVLAYWDAFRGKRPRPRPSPGPGPATAEGIPLRPSINPRVMAWRAVVPIWSRRRTPSPPSPAPGGSSSSGS